MKRIMLTFLTEKGREAYRLVDDDGKKVSWKEKQIAKRFSTDKVVNKDPFTVEINVKIHWLAVQVKFDEQIVTGLEKFGAVRDKDYTMEVQ